MGVIDRNMSGVLMVDELLYTSLLYLTEHTLSSNGCNRDRNSNGDSCRRSWYLTIEYDG